jgi:hypothetical protein
MKTLQILPKQKFRLYGAVVKKEIELANKNQGTFRRTGKKEKNVAKWSHKKIDGWIWLGRGLGEVVVVEIQTRSTIKDEESQLFKAFLGFLDRHFSKRIASINIQFD